MKLSLLALTISHAAAFAPAAKQRQSSSTSLGMSSHHIVDDPHELSEVRNEAILNALGNMEGPSISYGHFAALENRKPTDIKGYDNFDAFKAAIDQAECTKLLRGNGPFTVFAPTNTAIENFDGILTEEVIKTHIIPQDLYTDELVGEFETLSGHKLKCENKFRKIYADQALIGQLDNHSGGTPYPTKSSVKTVSFMQSILSSCLGSNTPLRTPRGCKVLPFRLILTKRYSKTEAHSPMMHRVSTKISGVVIEGKA